MSRKAQDSAAAVALRRNVQQEVTGRLTVGAGASAISVYLMDGAIVAATSPDDERQLVHLLQRQGVLRRKVAQDFEARLERSESIFGELLKYGGAPLEVALVNRFENNLATFIGSVSKPTFAALRTVFVDNLQMGHDTPALIDRVSRLWDAASSLDVDATLAAGHVPFESEAQLWVAKAVGRGERTASAILLDLPMEELHARVVLLEMLEKGMIRIPGSEPEPADEPTESRAEPPVEDQETVFGVDVAMLAAAALGDDEEPAPEPVEDVHEVEVDVEVDIEPFEEVEVDLDPEPSAPSPVEAEVDTVVDRPPIVPPTTGRASLPPTARSAAPKNLDEWMEQASVVDEDELDFFQDYDHDRGKGAKGSFSTDTHNLDRIEVVGMDEGPKDEVIEVAEVPAAKFGAPVLGEDEALEKLGVANDVLAHVVQAFDAAEGAGRGRSVVQLLVDGSPSNFAHLLRDVRVSDEGALSDEDVLGNLYARPPTEHRHLINGALADIIERALSSAADELPEEQFDPLFSSVAGYRQRLGL